MHRKEKEERMARVKREILPKMLRKLFLSKKRDHFDQLTMGLLTLKADKRNHRWCLMNNMVEILAKKTHLNKKLSFKRMVKHAHESSYSAFNFSDEYDFDSSHMSPEVDRPKVHATMRMLAAMKRLVKSQCLDCWLTIRMNDSIIKKQSFKSSAEKKNASTLSTMIGSDLIKF